MKALGLGSLPESKPEETEGAAGEGAVAPAGSGSGESKSKGKRGRKGRVAGAPSAKAAAAMAAAAPSMPSRLLMLVSGGIDTQLVWVDAGNFSKGHPRKVLLVLFVCSRCVESVPSRCVGCHVV